MGAPIVFYKTNSVDDLGHVVDLDQLVAEFTASAEHAEWAELGGRLSRWVMGWLSQAHGQTDDPLSFGNVAEAIVERVLTERRA